jgi:hypothetical protein
MMANTDFPFSGCLKCELKSLGKIGNRWRVKGSLHLKSFNNLSSKKPFGSIPNGFVFSFVTQAASGA